MKRCCRCKIEFPISSFPKSKSKPSGVTSYCSFCKSIKAAESRARVQRPYKKVVGRVQKYRRRWYAAQFCIDCGVVLPKRKKKYCSDCYPKVMTRSRVSVEWFEETLRKQNHACAICVQKFSDKRRPAVDHDHSTGMIRAILCRQCNSALGLFGENSIALSNAITYLKTFTRSTSEEISPLRLNDLNPNDDCHSIVN
jgi:hypothetical protein